MGRCRQRLYRLLIHTWTRYVLAWLLALGSGGASFYNAWTNFDDSARKDGNKGHVFIDFGGQWTMGRMLVRGHGRQLYLRNYQRSVLREAYPRADQDPSRPWDSDADSLMGAFMKQDDPRAPETAASYLLPLGSQNPLQCAATLDCAGQYWEPDRLYQLAQALAPLAGTDALAVCAIQAEAQQAWQTGRIQGAIPSVGGPLYPPVHALYMYPLGLLRPQLAYRLAQLLHFVFALLTALAIRQIAQGRIWFPMAAAAIFAFPGFTSSAALAQNAGLSMVILAWGWALIASGRQFAGGIAWGLFAFKPVWGLAIFLVPLVTQRWRTCLGMAASSAALVVATLPLVGLESWRNWLQVGREAARIYDFDENWITLSRDLLSLPRRWMLDFSASNFERDRDCLLHALAGWALLAAALEITVRVMALRPERLRASTGPAAAFVLLGAWLTCYHFMYYDALLGVLPVLLLFTDARRFFEPLLWAIVPVSEEALGGVRAGYYRIQLPRAYPAAAPLLGLSTANLWVLNRMAPTWAVLFAIAVYFPRARLPFLNAVPWETVFFLALWLWCGWLTLAGKDEAADGSTGVTDPLAYTRLARRSSEARPVEA